MRGMLVAVVLALLLALLGGSAVQVAGDTGPGQNGSVPTLTDVAGDTGPGQNG